jgi:hypothetical protein
MPLESVVRISMTVRFLVEHLFAISDKQHDLWRWKVESPKIIASYVANGKNNMMNGVGATGTGVSDRK